MSPFRKRFCKQLPADAVTIPASARGVFHPPPAEGRTDTSAQHRFRRDYGIEIGIALNHGIKFSKIDQGRADGNALA